MSETAPSKVATKCGIRYNPPALIIIYEERTMNNTVYKRKRIIPLRNFNSETDVNLAASDLQPRYLTDIDLDASVVLRMLKKVKAQLYGSQENVLEAERMGMRSYSPTEEESGTKVDFQHTQENKEDVFNKNHVKPGDKNFIYDKRIDFNPNAEADWDKDDLDNFFDI